MPSVERRRRWIAAGLCSAAVLAVTFERPSRSTAAAFQAGQAVEVREGDTWSSATVLKREGRKYQVHYAGSDASTDEWVTPDRVRLPGGATPPAAVTPPPAPVPTPETPKADDAATTPPADAPVPRAHRTHGKPGDMFPEPDEVMPVTEANRTAVDVQQVPDAPAEWAVPLDAVAAKSGPAPRAYAIGGGRSGGGGMDVRQLLPCLNGGAVVGLSDFGDKSRLVQRVGAGTPMKSVLPAQSLPLAASPDGSVLVCRCRAFGFGNNARIDMFTLDAGATPLVSFKPYPDESGNGKGEDVRFAAALSNTRIVTCDLKGRLIAWDAKAGSVTGIWRADLGDMHFGGDETVDVMLSPSGKWLAAAGRRALWFVDPTNGRPLGRIDLDGLGSVYDLACSPTGKTMVARSNNGSLVSFDLTTGKRIREVATESGMAGGLACPDDGFALCAGRVLVSTNTGAIVPCDQPVASQIAAISPAGLMVASNGKLSVVHIPDASTKASVAAAGDSVLALKPGTEVSLDVSLPDVSAADVAAVDRSLRQRLQADGFVIKDGAATVIVCRTEPGQQHEHVYGRTSMHMPFMHLMPGQGQSMILTDKVTRLTIQQKGQTVWERKKVSGPANSIPIKEGESIEETVKATIKYDPGFLEALSIPPYIAKPGATATAPDDGTPRPAPHRVRPSNSQGDA